MPLTERAKARYKEALERGGIYGEELQRRFNVWVRAMEETEKYGPLGYLGRDALRIRESLLSAAFRGGLKMPRYTQVEAITKEVDTLMSRVFEGPTELAKKARDDLRRMAKRLGVEVW